MTNDQTGFEQVGFRPIGGHIAILLTDQQLRDFEEEEDEARKALGEAREDKSNVELAVPKLFKGDALEKEIKERETTYVVVAISEASVDNKDLPKVGDRIGLQDGTPLSQLKVNGRTYAIIPIHKIFCIFKLDAKVTA